MAQWDLRETYQLVRRVFDREQERLTKESSQSVAERQAFSRYHFREVIRLTKAFEKKHLADTQTFLDIHTVGAEKKQHAFRVYMVKVGAHSVAAVQSLHAIPDIFAHAVYFASGQNLQPHAIKDESKIALKSVAECLEKDKRFAALSNPLRAIQSADRWGHLAAVSNMGKHRSIVRSVYNEDWTGTRSQRRELHVLAFEWHGQRYPEVSLEQLLEPAHTKLMELVLDIACELNARLRTAT